MLDLSVMNDQNKSVLTTTIGYFGYLPGEKANVSEGQITAFARDWRTAYLKNVGPSNIASVPAPNFVLSPSSQNFIRNSTIECADAGGVLTAVAISSGKLGHAEIVKDALIEASKSAPDKFTASWSLASLGKLVAAFPELDENRKVTDYLKACAKPSNGPIAAVKAWWQSISSDDRAQRIQYSAQSALEQIRQAHPERTDLPEAPKTRSDPYQYVSMVMNEGLKKKLPELHKSICDADPGLSGQVQLEAAARAPKTANAKMAPEGKTGSSPDLPTQVAQAIFEKLRGRTATM